MRVHRLLAIALIGGLAAATLAAPARAQADPALKREALDIQTRVKAMLPAATAATVLVRAVVHSPRGPGAAMGSGSGVCISAEGEVLTCAHVVEMDGATLTVRLADGRECPARLVGMHAQQDYALLRLEGEGPFPCVPLGTAADLKAGQWVVALGHPLRPNRDNLPSCSVGLVRNAHVSLDQGVGQRRYPDAVMHDAPLFSGNSGGPLFDLAGRCIGLNAAITIFDENGYAVPIDRIRAELEALRAGKSLGPRIGAAGPEVARPRGGGALPGLVTYPADDQVGKIWDLPEGVGECIRRVEPGSPAERAGLRAKDIVVAIDGADLPRGKLAETLREREPGADVRLTVIREFARQELRTKLPAGGR